VTPLVSIVVLCFNYGRYLAECVASVQAQAINDVEIIVVDDGSTDETAAVAAALAGPRVRVITHPKNLGLLASLTDGLTAARGVYLARIDADDRYRPEFLSEAVAIFDGHPDAGMVFGDVAGIDTDGRVLADPWPGIRSREAHGGRDFHGDEFLATLEENVIPAPAMIARRPIYQAGLPFPAWFTSQGPSDWYLNLQIARRHPVYYRARTLADYRLHASNMHRRAVNVADYEHTVLGVLDQMLEGDDRRAAKRASRGRLYARAYLSCANQYFAQAQYGEARRCYARAARHRPADGLRPTPVRRWVTTFLPAGWYARVKRATRAGRGA
jgi:glycosyltransferase involved in cell wall biosynthesis